MPKLIPVAEPHITEKEIEYVNDAVRSGWVSSLGPYLNKFESSFAEFCGTQHALTVCNATAGLHLALLSCGVGEGDEVIVPDFSFVATANAVVHSGAKPVFADINPEILTIDPSSIQKLITKKTKAIMPVHVYGHPAEMDKINEIAEKHNLYVIEDSAEALGAECHGQRVGSLGDVAVFSFYGNKIITTGEGGMLTTNDEEIASRASKLRDHAMRSDKRYWHDQVGYNYRMTNMQAALGLAQLERIDEILEKKNWILNQYKKNLGDIPGVKFNSIAKWAKLSCWMVCLEVEGWDEDKRETFMRMLKEKGIDSRPYFFPISDMPMYKKANTPATHQVYSKGINLPSYFNLKEIEIKYICDQLSSLLDLKSFAKAA